MNIKPYGILLDPVQKSYSVWNGDNTNDRWCDQMQQQTPKESVIGTPGPNWTSSFKPELENS